MTGRTTRGCIALAAAAGLVSLTPVLASADSPATPHGPVIVVLRAQSATGGTGLPSTSRAPRATAHAEQDAVANSIQNNGGTVRDQYRLINAIAATVSASEAANLAQDSQVAEVIPDSTIQEATPDSRSEQPDAAPTTGSAQPPHAPVTGACPSSPSGVELGPEALSVTHADSDVPGAKTARSLGYSGTGVTVGFIADGIDINNPDFIRDGKSIFSDYQDFSGDGTAAPTDGDEAFLDAGAIAAQGNQTYDLAQFSNLPLSRPCLMRIEGEAPGVNLVGLKVFSNNVTTTSAFLQAIDYAADTDHVNVLNESFGGNSLPDTTQDVIKAADDAAIAQGVTVTASTGDAGVTNTIGSPATDPAVIAVGASTTFQAYLQTGYHGATLPGITGWLDNNISSLSSSGFSTSGRSVDLVAPGDINFAPCSTDLDNYQGCGDFTGAADGLEESGGTSESAPTVAGVAALVIQAYRAGHHGQTPSPAVVKAILLSSADDIDAPAQQQGAGLVDAYRAVLLAKAYGATGAPTAQTLQLSASHFAASGAAGAKSTFKEKITNPGAGKVTVAASSRALGAYTSIASTTVTLNDQTSQQYVDYAGLADNVAKTTFTVPAHESRLSASIAWQGASFDLAARDRLLLIDPNGDLAGSSIPQGVGNYGHSEVANPVAGTWTAYVYSRTSGNGGSVGTVQFAASVAKFTKFGAVSPASVTLAPGKSATVTLTVKNPSTPGDASGSVVLASAAAGKHKPVKSTSTVPVTLRTLIAAGTQSFTATLTGGNGRDSYPGDVFFYQTQVAANTPALNAAVSLTKNSENPFDAILVSPGGNNVAETSNATNPGDSNPVQPATDNAVQLNVAAPQAGLWTLVVDFTPVVSGQDISTPFVVSTDNTPLTMTVQGVPNSAQTVVNSGGTAATITITNNSPTTEEFFADPRLSGTSNYNLLALGSAQTDTPPSATDNEPQYLVPSDTTSLTASATTTGSQPIQFDASPLLGDPDIGSNTGLSPTLTYAAQPVTPGQWGIDPAQIGPFSSPSSSEPVDTTMTATTRTFDDSAETSTGDLWGLSTNAEVQFNPVTIAPKSTGTITVNFQPGASTSVVSGTLYIDTFSETISYDSTYYDYFGNQAAAVPYEYTAN